MSSNQIDRGQYYCPSCKNELYVEGTDFINHVHGGVSGDTKINWKCFSCQEKFFTLEKSYVYPSDKAPQFNCLYCNGPTKFHSLFNDWTDYRKCDVCNVSFESSYSANHIGAETINLYTIINDRQYVVRQFMWQNKCRVDFIPEDINELVVKVAEFDFILPQVTPANIQEKLKTYILFL